jgi:hypothetical protein
MIYERWGAPVEVLGGNLALGEVHVRTLDGTYEEPHYLVGYLRATGGFTEVHDAIERANARKEAP